jgi:hypothetical protein
MEKNLGVIEMKEETIMKLVFISSTFMLILGCGIMLGLLFYAIT